MEARLLDLAERALRRAESFGADQAEVYVASSKSFSIDVENSAIKSAQDKRDSGCGIRSVVGKGVGFAYVTTLQDDDIAEAAEKSVQLASSSIEDPTFVTLPAFDGTYPKVTGIFDKRIDQLTSEEAADLILRAVDATKSELEGWKPAVEARLAATSGLKAIANSLGISGAARSTSIWLYTYPTIKSGSDQTSSYEFQLLRNLSGIDPEWVGRTSALNAIGNLGGKTIDGGDMPVIFTPLAVGTVIGQGFGGAVNAEEVQYGRSYIADAIGEEVASGILEITDDGLLPGGLGTRAFDSEGVPSQRTEVISKGVLKGLLHNSYTANKDQVENTGNASRPSYAGTPSISSSNFVVTQDRGTLDDLIEEAGKGIVCRNTGDRPNMTTGDLSAMVMEGSYFENGEIQFSVKSTLIGINMRDVLLRVTRIGADTRSVSSVISPSIMIDSAKITSG
ncbi:MAG: TldD/PmbA family protein [Candidatus Thorarchaeota archaeon]|nr:TldD/PmbA family protein [Candidatus Thorarchaeota archaeon]